MRSSITFRRNISKISKLIISMKKNVGFVNVFDIYVSIINRCIENVRSKFNR